MAAPITMPWGPQNLAPINAPEVAPFNAPYETQLFVEVFLLIVLFFP